MAIKPQLEDGRIFQEFAGLSEDKYRVRFAGPLEPGDREIVMKADIAIEDLASDVTYPVVRYPQDAPKAERQYEVSFSMQVEPGIFEKLDALITDDVCRRAKLDKPAIMHPDFAAFFRKLWTDRYCHASGGISGKGVRRMMADIRHNTIRGEDPQRFVVTDLVDANIGRMNPNKIARLIRRKLRRDAWQR